MVIKTVVVVAVMVVFDHLIGWSIVGGDVVS